MSDGQRTGLVARLRNLPCPKVGEEAGDRRHPLPTQPRDATAATATPHPGQGGATCRQPMASGPASPVGAPPIPNPQRAAVSATTSPPRVPPAPQKHTFPPAPRPVDPAPRDQTVRQTKSRKQPGTSSLGKRSPTDSGTAGNVTASDQAQPSAALAARLFVADGRGSVLFKGNVAGQLAVCRAGDTFWLERDGIRDWYIITAAAHGVETATGICVAEFVVEKASNPASEGSPKRKAPEPRAGQEIPKAGSKIDHGVLTLACWTVTPCPFKIPDSDLELVVTCQENKMRLNVEVQTAHDGRFVTRSVALSKASETTRVKLPSRTIVLTWIDGRFCHYQPTPQTFWEKAGSEWKHDIVKVRVQEFLSTDPGNEDA